MLLSSCASKPVFDEVGQEPYRSSVPIRHLCRTLQLNKSPCVVQMDCNFANFELSTTDIYMEDSVVLIASTISVVINMLTIYRDIVNVQGGALGETTNHRLSHSVIKARGAMDIDISITVIYFYLKIRSGSVNSEGLNLFVSIQSKSSCSLISGNRLRS